MPQINTKILAYLAIGAAVLLVGLHSLKTDRSSGESVGALTQPGQGQDKGKNEFRVSGGTRKLVVDVGGAVRRPGVYRFTQGARVVDAIDRAGGLTGEALPGGINRAAILSDGQQVVVPLGSASGNGSDGLADSTDPSVESSSSAPVSFGTATQEQLEEIDGIGPVTAGKIIEFRNSQGGVGSIDELDQVSGIGPVTMESLRAALAP